MTSLFLVFLTQITIGMMYPPSGTNSGVSPPLVIMDAPVVLVDETMGGCRVCRNFPDPVSHRFLGNGEDPEPGDENAQCEGEECHEYPVGDTWCVPQLPQVNPPHHESCDEDEEDRLALEDALSEGDSEEALALIRMKPHLVRVRSGLSAVVVLDCSGVPVSRYIADFEVVEQIVQAQK